MDTVDAHSHHGELLEGVIVGLGGGSLVGEAVGRLLDLGVGTCATKLGARGKFKGIGAGMSVSQTTRISERCCVDFHSLGRSYVDRCESVIQRAESADGC